MGTGDYSLVIGIMDSVERILTSVGSPIILGMFGFALLSLFLHFRK